MRIPRAAGLALVAAALCAPHPASSEVTFGARAFGGYNTYAMDDWDDVRRALFIPAGSVATPSDGYSLGVSAEMAFGPWLAITGSYERLVPGRMSEVNGQKLQLPANALLLEAEFRRRLSSRFRFGIGGGIGHYQLGDEVESPGTGRNLEGEKLGAQAFALGEWDWTSSVALGLDIGYRWAAVDVHKVNRQPPRTETVMDYSGLHTRLVLRLHQKSAR